MLLSAKNENEISNPIAEACQKGMDSTNSERSSFTIGEKLCGVLIPLVAIVEVLICNLAACFHRHSPEKLNYSFDDIVRLANDSPFSVNEVEALRELFKKLSSSIIDDDLIHKEELQLALFNSHARNNIFLDKVFDLFDEKQNGVIEFEEFVHVLSVFHPSASVAQKVDFAFRLYDLRQTGYIEREEVREMVLAIFVETNTFMSNEILDDIIDKTFKDADTDQDGKISKEEWEAFVFRNPTLLRNMTLPQLKDVTTTFPSFIFNTEVVD